MENGKMQIYQTIYLTTCRTIAMLHHCKDANMYIDLSYSLVKEILRYYADDRITEDMLYFLDCKISMCNVECGIWDSEQERATAYHPSRRYNQNKFI